MRKKISFFVFFLFLFYEGYSQQQVNICISSTTGIDSLYNHNCMKRCSVFVRKHYPNKKLPNIYLDLRRNREEKRYILSYNGFFQDWNSYSSWSEEPKLEEPVDPDDICLPGIRIEVWSVNYELDPEVLKLLKYGIEHERELKRIRKQYYKGKRPYNAVDSVTIQKILRQPLKE